MANTKVEFLVKAPTTGDLYLVGNVKALGEWDASKAIKLNYCEECGKYTVSKLLPLDSFVEFKILAGKTWDKVEKGTWCEDIANHTFAVTKGCKVEIEVYNF